MDFISQISIANWTAIASVLLAVYGALFALRSDRLRRQRERADTIREAAGFVLMKMDRTKKIYLSIHDRISKTFVDCDKELVESSSKTKARDMMWAALVEQQALTNQAVLDEEIELSYATLSGYNPQVEEIFNLALSHYTAIADKTFGDLLHALQHETLTSVSEDGKGYVPATLGNRLRTLSAIYETTSRQEYENVWRAFKVEMLKIINASDDEIFRKRIKLDIQGLMQCSDNDSSNKAQDPLHLPAPEDVSDPKDGQKALSWVPCEYRLRLAGSPIVTRYRHPRYRLETLRRIIDENQIDPSAKCVSARHMSLPKTLSRRLSDDTPKVEGKDNSSSNS